MGRRAWALALAAAVAIDASATQRCDEVQANAYTTGAQSRPAVAMLTDGRFVAAWTSDGSPGTDTDDRSIQARFFDQAGVPAGPQFQVNGYTTGRQTSPDVAVDTSTGRFLVVWDGVGSTGSDTSAQSVQARLFDSDGSPIGPDVQVNSFTTSTQRDARVAPRPGGGFVVVWESNGSPDTDTDGFAVLGRTVGANGAPEGADFQVSAYTTSYQIDPAIAAGADGFLVVWVSGGSPETDTSSTSVLARRLDASGAPLASDFQVNAWTTSFQDGPDVAPDDAGGFVVAWQSNGGAGDDDQGSIQARHVPASGGLGTESQVNVWTVGDQRALTVASDGAGGLVVTWTSEGGPETDTDGWSIQGRGLDPSGMPAQEQFQVNTFEVGDQYGPRLAGTKGAFAIVWRSMTGSAGDVDGAVQLGSLALGSCDGGATTTTSTSSPTSTTSSTTLTSTTSFSSTTMTVPGSTSTSATATTATSSSATTLPTTITTTTSGGSTTSTSLLPRQPLAGRKLVLREARSGRRSRPAMALLVVRDPMLQAAFDDGVPAAADARIVSLAGTFDVRASFDPAGWRTRRRSIRYRDDDGTRLVLARGRKLRLLLAGFDLALGDVMPTPIVAELTLGVHRFCVVFSEASLSARRRRLVARRQDPTVTCPVVPETLP